MPKKYPNSFCVVSNVSDVGSVLGIKRKILGASEIVPSCSSPEWATVITIEHTRGTEHKIAVDVFHSMLCDTENGGTHNIQQSERRGHLEVNHAQQLCGTLLDVETILSNRNGVLQEKLAHGCSLFVRLEECAGESSTGAFKFHVRGLDCQNTRRNFLDRPDFVFEIRRKQRGKTQDSWALVYRSNVAKATCNPYWEQDVVDLATLVNNDVERDLQISIYDTPSRILLGYATTTIPGLVGAVNESGNADKALDIVKPSHSLLHSTTRQGKLVVLHASLSMANTDGSSHGGNLNGSSFTPCAPQERQESLSNLPQAVAVEIMSPPRNLTFEDYVASKQCSLELCVAVDFTRGNGDYRLEGMPHYRSEGRMNDYEWCMGVMAESIRKYNNDPQIPLWGFGAQFHNTPYHIFQCGSSSLNHGSRELLNAYKSTFQTALEFGYETRYNEVIQASARHSKKQLDAAQTNNGLAYTVLLILTVGTERDIIAAKEQVQTVSAAPLSIVFVRIDNGMHTSPLKVTEIDPNCTILEGSDFTKSRDARVFAEAVMKSVKSHLADYFLSQSIYPPPSSS
jgi:hypothetical protein